MSRLMIIASGLAKNQMRWFLGSTRCGELTYSIFLSTRFRSAPVNYVTSASRMMRSMGFRALLTQMALNGSYFQEKIKIKRLSKCMVLRLTDERKSVQHRRWMEGSNNTRQFAHFVCRTLASSRRCALRYRGVGLYI